MAKTIISVNGFEIFSEASVEVKAERENKVLENKLFSGATFDEIRDEVDKYVQYLRKKYHPAVVRSNLPRKGATMNILKSLVKIANDLDRKGHYDLAQEVDFVVKMAASHSNIIRALKSDDNKAVRKALADFIGSLPWGAKPDKELGMASDEYRDFVNAIKNGDLEKARKIFGVEIGEEDKHSARMREWEEIKEDADKYGKEKSDKDSDSGMVDLFSGDDAEGLDKRLDKTINDDKCERCRGRGHITNPRVMGPADDWYIDCPSCGGTGKKR